MLDLQERLANVNRRASQEVIEQNRGASQVVIEQNTLLHTYKKVCKHTQYNVQRKWLNKIHILCSSSSAIFLLLDLFSIAIETSNASGKLYN